MSAHDFNSVDHNSPSGARSEWWRVGLYSGQIVFSQLMEFLPIKRRRRCLTEARRGAQSSHGPQPNGGPDFLVPQVFFIDHDGGEISLVAESLSDFLSWDTYTESERST